MKLLCLLFIFSYNCSIHAQQQKLNGKAEIGVNLGPLYTGIPEFQVGYFIKEIGDVDLGLVASGGYHLYPYNTLYKIDSPVDVLLFNGPYFRLGIKGRYYFVKDNHAANIWLQALGVHTSYNEISYHNIKKSEKHISDSGIGFTAATGMDIFLSKHIDFRFGFQSGVAPKFKGKVSDFTPGFGWRGIPIQFILGLNVRFL